MIQQVIPMDLIPSYLPSYLIYIFSFPLSDVVITPPSPARLFQHQLGAVMKSSECLSRRNFSPLYTYEYFKDRQAE